MAREKNRSRSDHKPFERGMKTHKADVRQNRGEPEEPQPEYRAISEEERETRRQEKLREEHPTRMKATGRNPDRRNR
jgi:hypothetical protein